MEPLLTQSCRGGRPSRDGGVGHPQEYHRRHETLPAQEREAVVVEPRLPGHVAPENLPTGAVERMTPPRHPGAVAEPRIRGTVGPLSRSHLRPPTPSDGEGVGGSRRGT